MPQPRRFECRLYISEKNHITQQLPYEAGPRPIVIFSPIEQDKLIDPEFRRLLAALDRIPQPIG